MKYSEKLKDPRWQKKRLKILERDNWSCVVCGSKDKMLVVHHYDYKGDPWDIDNRFLATMCQECHENEHFAVNHYKEVLLKDIKGLDSNDLLALGIFVKFGKTLPRIKMNALIKETIKDLEKRTQSYDK